MVIVRINGTHGWGRCGGSIVASKYVVTAAHCFVFGGNPKNIYIEFGYGTKSLPHHYQLVTRVLLHPSYSSYDNRIGHHDIALLQTSQHINLKLFTPVCLPHAVKMPKDSRKTEVIVYRGGRQKAISGFMIPQYKDICTANPHQSMICVLHYGEIRKVMLKYYFLCRFKINFSRVTVEDHY